MFHSMTPIELLGTFLLLFLPAMCQRPTNVPVVISNNGIPKVTRPSQISDEAYVINMERMPLYAQPSWYKNWKTFRNVMHRKPLELNDPTDYSSYDYEEVDERKPSNLNFKYTFDVDYYPVSEPIPSGYNEVYQLNAPHVDKRQLSSSNVYFEESGNGLLDTRRLKMDRYYRLIAGLLNKMRQSDYYKNVLSNPHLMPIAYINNYKQLENQPDNNMRPRNYDSYQHLYNQQKYKERKKNTKYIFTIPNGYNSIYKSLYNLLKNKIKRKNHIKYYSQYNQIAKNPRLNFKQYLYKLLNDRLGNDQISVDYSKYHQFDQLSYNRASDFYQQIYNQVVNRKIPSGKHQYVSDKKRRNNFNNHVQELYTKRIDDDDQIPNDYNENYIYVNDRLDDDEKLDDTEGTKRKDKSSTRQIHDSVLNDLFLNDAILVYK